MTADRSSVPLKCLQCKAELSTPIVCEGCHTLYPILRSTDYFELLGLPRRFAVDPARLVASFRAIAKNVHPDRFTNEPREVRNLATNLTAELNQAVRVLHDPVRRADYMLERAGGPSAGQVRDVPGNFLAEVMMLREEIDDARTAADAATLERHQSGLNARREDALRRIADVADRLATASDNEKMEFRKLLNAIKYFDNLLAELAVDPLETAMGAVRG